MKNNVLNHKTAQGDGWSRSRFLIRLSRTAEPNDTGVRSGRVCGPFGLHSILNTHRRFWRLTHIPSGRYLADRIRTLEEAKNMVKAILPMADWTQKCPLKDLTWKQREEIRGIVESGRSKKMEETNA